MSTHIDTLCPNCGRSLRLRQEYVGKTVACKQCQHTFKAQAQATDDRALSAPVPENGPKPDVDEQEQLDAVHDILQKQRAGRQADREKIGQLTAELQTVRDDRERLDRERQEAVAKAVRRKERLARFERDLDTERLGHQTTRDDLSRQLEAARDRETAEQEKGLRLTGELDAVRAERETLDRDRQAAVAEAARIAGELEAVRAKQETLDRDRQAAVAEAARHKDRLTELERDLDAERLGHQTTHTSLTREADADRVRESAEREELQKRLEREHQAEVTALQQDLAHRNAQAEAERGEARDRLDSERAAFLKERESLGAKIEQLRSEAEAARQERDLARTRVEELEPERDRLDAGLIAARERLEHEQAALPRTIGPLRADIEALKSERDAFRHQLQTAEQDRARLIAGHADTQSADQVERARLLAELEQSLRNRESAVAERDALANQARALETGDQASRDRLAELDAQFRAGNERTGRLETELQAAARTHAALNDALALARRQNQTLNEDLQETRQAARELRSYLERVGIHLP